MNWSEIIHLPSVCRLIFLSSVHCYCEQREEKMTPIFIHLPVIKVTSLNIIQRDAKYKCTWRYFPMRWCNFMVTSRAFSITVSGIYEKWTGSPLKCCPPMLKKTLACTKTLIMEVEKTKRLFIQYRIKRKRQEHVIQMHYIVRKMDTWCSLTTFSLFFFSPTLFEFFFSVCERRNIFCQQQKEKYINSSKQHCNNLIKWKLKFTSVFFPSIFLCFVQEKKNLKRNMNRKYKSLEK